MASRSSSAVNARLHRIADAARSSGIAMSEDRIRALIAEEFDRRIAKRDHRMAETDRRVTANTKALEAMADRDFTLKILVGGRPGADRTLNRARWDRLREQVQSATGIADVRHVMAQEYLGLLDVESRGLGRIAGSTYNILGKLLMPTLLEAPEGDVLEIGTLYGLFTPALMRSFRRRGQFRNLTIVDPLAGFQLQGGKGFDGGDPSGTPVVADVVRRNFADLGIREDEARVIPGYSTDTDIQTQAGDRKYAVVVVDGDHYEEGVLKDLWWVETILAPGGVAVLDDYGDDKWPGVEKAVERYLADGGVMTFTGAVSTSGYMRMPVPVPEAGPGAAPAGTEQTLPDA